MTQSAKACRLLRDCRTYLFDCDGWLPWSSPSNYPFIGVLWDSNGLLPDARSLIEYLIGTERSVFLITNNSTKSTEQYASKCQKLGLPVTDVMCHLVLIFYQANIICSASIAASCLSSHGIKGPVYVVGEDGIGLELDKLGIQHHGIGVRTSESSWFVYPEFPF